MSKGFLDIKVGDVVIVANEYSHDIDRHRIKVESIEFDEEYINGEYNPKGMRCYGIDLDYWDEETQEYDTDDYVIVVTEENFLAIDEEE